MATMKPYADTVPLHTRAAHTERLFDRNGGSVETSWTLLYALTFDIITAMSETDIEMVIRVLQSSILTLYGKIDSIVKHIEE